MTTDPRPRHDIRKPARQPVSLGCSNSPTKAQRESLAEMIAARNPGWKPGYCELRAVVEFMKGPV